MLQDKIYFNSAHNSEWLYVPDHPYRILINDSSQSGKGNTLLNLIIHQPDIYKIYLYAKDSYKNVSFFD